MTIVIPPLDRMFGTRAQAHVFEKSCEGVSPSGAHTNTSLTVLVVPGIVVVVTSSVDVGPSSVFWRLSFFTGASVSRLMLLGPITAKATATSGVAAA